MDLSAFYEECKSLSEKDRKGLDAFRESVDSVFGEENQDFKRLDKVHGLFYGKKSSLGKATYYQKKNLICKLYDWLKKQGAIDDECLQKVRSLKMQDVVSDALIYRHYFRSLDEVLDFVNLVGREKGLGDRDDMLNFKTLAILSWYQFEISELEQLRKSNLHPETYEIIVGEKRIKFLPEHFNVVLRFSELDVHQGFPSGKQQVYMSSPFLMRSARQEHMNYNNIQKAIQRFNSIVTNYGKELSMLDLRRNGVFSQVYAMSGDRSINSLIQELTGCDTAFAAGYKILYEKWKTIVMEGDDIDRCLHML